MSNFKFLVNKMEDDKNVKSLIKENEHIDVENGIFVLTVHIRIKLFILYSLPNQNCKQRENMITRSVKPSKGSQNSSFLIPN